MTVVIVVVAAVREVVVILESLISIVMANMSYDVVTSVLKDFLKKYGEFIQQ